MKSLLAIALAFPLLCTVHADVARQQSVMHYQRLLSNSPFTLPPVVVQDKDNAAEASVLDDWQLSGVLPYGDSYFVILNHKTKKGKSEYLRGVGEPSESGFELLEVVMANDPTKARVRIKGGNRTRWMAFDLVGLGVPAAKPLISAPQKNSNANNRSNLPPGFNNKNKKAGGVRAPRPRARPRPR